MAEHIASQQRPLQVYLLIIYMEMVKVNLRTPTKREREIESESRRRSRLSRGAWRTSRVSPVPAGNFSRATNSTWHMDKTSTLMIITLDVYVMLPASVGPLTPSYFHPDSGSDTSELMFLLRKNCSKAR